VNVSGKVPEHNPGKARTRSGRPFVGRMDMIGLFRDMLRKHQRQIETVGDALQPQVLNFWGLSGIGKSELLRQLRWAAGEEFHATVFAGVEFQMGAATSIDLALQSIRREAKEKYRVACPTFDIGFATYWKVTRPDFSLQQSQFPFWDEAGLASDLLKVVADAPVVDWLSKIPKAITTLSQAVGKWWTKRGQQALTGLPFLNHDEILQRLPFLLAIDLEAHQREAEVMTPIVIYFDAYESLWGDRRKPSNIYHEDAWIRELIRQLPSALFVIAGQQPLRWHEKWPDWTDSINSYELEDLTEKCAEEFLTGSGVTEAEIRERITSGSKGVPFYLELSVNTYIDTVKRGEKPQVDQFGGTFDQIFTRFLFNLKEYEQLALKVLSAPRNWDMPLAELMLTEFVSSFPLSQLDEFHRFSFVKHDAATGRYVLHELMRFHLQDAKEYSDFHRSTMHPWLLEQYDAMLNDIDIKKLTEPHRLALTEGFYHAGQTHTVTELFDWTMEKTSPFYEAAEWALLVPVYKVLIDRLKESLK